MKNQDNLHLYGKGESAVARLKCHMLKLLDKDFKSAIIIMVQEVWINTLEKE